MLGENPSGQRPHLTIRVSGEQIDKLRNDHFEGLFHYLHALCMASDQVRHDYWKLDSTSPSDRSKKVANLRAQLGDLEGVIPAGSAQLNPRTLLIGETEKFLAYDVLIDVVTGVEAYGQLLVPRSVAGRVDQKLPAMICQHGLSGHPIFLSGVGGRVEMGDQQYFHRFGQRLAERGYVVFAPYLSIPGNPSTPAEARAKIHIHGYDLINDLAREAACLGMMRTSIELAKLHRIVDFLQSLPFVDGNRIGYYGISYGGLAALWMPPLEPRLKFTIVSGYFTDWRSTLLGEPPPGYWRDPDEDVYNWNDLNRFTHPELIAAMWPRPVCIEYGLNDPNAPKVRHQRAEADVNEFVRAWGFADSITDDHFIGPHEIHGIGTFSFIDRWLRPERSAGRDYGCNDNGYCYKVVAPGFHGYAEAPQEPVPYVTQVLDSDKDSLIRGSFYVSNVSPVLTGMAFKLSRAGNPGDMILRLGSREGKSDIGQARISSSDVYPQYDLWYETKVQKPIPLNPRKLYWFELKAESGQSPKDYYTVYGPKPLGGQDYPHSFGLSFRVLTQGGK